MDLSNYRPISNLFNRRQFVSRNGHISNQTSVKYGVHQGSVLGPLFNKYINLDMKNLTDWLNANKISLNVKKTELVIFKHKKKKLVCPIRIKLSRKIIYLSNSVRYLDVKIDENLNWKDHIHDIATRLNRANALLFKIRNYVNFNTLKSIYFAIFDSHINYANLIWGQNVNSGFLIVTLQKKSH